MSRRVDIIRFGSLTRLMNLLYSMDVARSWMPYEDRGSYVSKLRKFGS